MKTVCKECILRFVAEMWEILPNTINRSRHQLRESYAIMPHIHLMRKDILLDRHKDFILRDNTTTPDCLSYVTLRNIIQESLVELFIVLFLRTSVLERR